MGSSHPPHICLVTEFPLVLDGRILNQAYTLSQAGYRVSIVDQSVPHDPDPLADLHRRLPAWTSTSCHVVRMAAHESAVRAALFRALQKPARPLSRWLVTLTLQQLRADAYQARSVETLRTVIPVVRRSGAKVLYDVRDFDTPHLLQTRSTRKRRHVVAAERRAMPYVAALTTVNESLARLVADYYKVPPPVVILNCKLVGAPESADLPNLRQQIGLAPGVALLVFTGVTTHSRGLPVVLIAAGRMPEVHVAFIGVHDHSGELMRLARGAGAETRVSFHPPVAAFDVPVYIRSADAAIIAAAPVNPNQVSALPNKLFEAVAAHLPLIASDIPEQRRIVEAYRIGALFDSDDPDELEHAIHTVLADRDTFQRNVRAASQELCWEREGVKYLEVYRRLIGTP